MKSELILKSFLLIATNVFKCSQALLTFPSGTTNGVSLVSQFIQLNLYNGLVSTCEKISRSEYLQVEKISAHGSPCVPSCSA